MSFKFATDFAQYILSLCYIITKVFVHFDMVFSGIVRQAKTETDFVPLFRDFLGVVHKCKSVAIRNIGRNYLLGILQVILLCHLSPVHLENVVFLQ